MLSSKQLCRHFHSLPYHRFSKRRKSCVIWTLPLQPSSSLEFLFQSPICDYFQLWIVLVATLMTKVSLFSYSKNVTLIRYFFSSAAD
ncbi:hypothetical protein WN943_009096 [Citrus x changshan-huyou]